MNEIQTFKNSEFGEIRMIEEDGKPLFCGSDVAKALGYTRARDAISQHCKGAVKRRTLTNGGKQTTSFIGEGDLYRLITHSKLPAAEKFEEWVFDEVLPSIRKTGKYNNTENEADEKEEKIIPQKTMWTVTRNGVDVQYFFRREDMLEYMELVRKHRSLMNPQVVLHMAQKEYSEKDKCMLSKEVLIFRCENNYCDMFLIEER